MTDEQTPLVQETHGESVTRQQSVIEVGSEREAVQLDPQTGASSEAPAGSGVPSADRERGVDNPPGVPETGETPLADRQDHTQQNLTP